MEIFKDIVGYEGKYKISNKGRVWSERRSRYLKPINHSAGYLRVSLCIGGGAKSTLIHRLVAQHFLENNDLEKNQVNHIDGDKKNNCVENLEWMTHFENMEHAVRTGLRNPKKCGLCKEIKLLNTKTGETEIYFSFTNFAEKNGYIYHRVYWTLRRTQSYKHYQLLSIS